MYKKDMKRVKRMRRGIVTIGMLLCMFLLSACGKEEQKETTENKSVNVEIPAEITEGTGSSCR